MSKTDSNHQDEDFWGRSTEQRQVARLQTRLETRFRIGEGKQAHRAFTKDISGIGVSLVSDQVVETGRELSVEIFLPGQEEPIRFKSQVIWSMEYAATCELGVKYLSIHSEDQERIMHFAASNFLPSDR